MQRHSVSPRAGWREKVEQVGLTYHTHDTAPYWDESACYQLSAREVDELESAANAVHQLCLAAVGTVIKRGWWDRLAIPAAAVPVIRQSWERADFTLYGRFDFAFDGRTPPKLLEYNADTPTALVEAAVAQWFWLQDCYPASDQFNSIHERLIARWKQLGNDRVHFSSVRDHPEDEQTVLYLSDTCEQAGLPAKTCTVQDIGWHPKRNGFVDQDDQKVTTLFKLYPWEWMWQEEFGQYLPSAPARFIEPVWKMLLSNKGLLPILWELNSGHPNLLPCFDSPVPLAGSHVQKPKLSREGSNVSIVVKGQVLEATGGDYGAEGCVYQALAPMADFAGHHPIFGVWMIGHEAGGLGIREDTRFITGNLSRFVPHYF